MIWVIGIPSFVTGVATHEGASADCQSPAFSIDLATTLVAVGVAVVLTDATVIRSVVPL